METGRTSKRFIAHMREKDRVEQPLLKHLNEASEFAGKAAEKIGLREAGELLGLLHDLGKASEEFQNYIMSALGLIDPDADEYVDFNAKKGEVDHSSAGAQALYERLKISGQVGAIAGQILALCIASHHSGLIDCLAPDGENKFQRRMNKNDDKTHSREALCNLSGDLGKVDNLLSLGIERQLVKKFVELKEDIDSQETLAFKQGLLIRFLFSCLIDGDRLSTADFESPYYSRLRNYGAYQPWDTLIQRLDQRIKEFENKETKNEVDNLRQQVSDDCFAFAHRSKGIYQLTVPTGGGKTLSSLRFALNHAAHHQMDRIIYVIPFTSIIDQNADQVRNILEDRDEKEQFLDRVVLEHHSNLTPEEESRRHGLLAENWDAPVVFTTQVQFLETLFSAGTRSARRMHQLANAVIIFDEVQTIPVRCVQMFNVALRFLVKACGSSVVLCTATQPLLDKVQPAQRALPIDAKIISNERELFERLRRVETFDRRKVGGWSDPEVADLVDQELREKGSVLVIVNTKKNARSLYQVIEERKTAEVFHLSTNMCPSHRLDVLSRVKGKLDSREPIICVSTQLIEAGVDIDFGTVIRYMAGLDSIVQAAGRCNRNGSRSNGNMWIVNPESESIDRLEDIVIGKDVAERVLADFSKDPESFDGDRIGLDSMRQYYEYYFFRRQHQMCYPVRASSPVGREDNLFNLLSTNKGAVAEYERTGQQPLEMAFRQSFQTAAKAFAVIDTPTRGVVVSYGKEGEQLINDLCSASEVEKQYRLLKRAQRYSVNLLPHEFAYMAEQNAIREVQSGVGVFYMDDQYYSEKFGWQNEIVNHNELKIV